MKVQRAVECAIHRIFGNFRNAFGMTPEKILMKKLCCHAKPSQKNVCCYTEPQQSDYDFVRTVSFHNDIATFAASSFPNRFSLPFFPSRYFLPALLARPHNSNSIEHCSYSMPSELFIIAIIII